MIQAEMFGLPDRTGQVSPQIRMLTTLTKPSQGRIEVSGFDVVRQPLLAKQCISVATNECRWRSIRLGKYGATWTVASPIRSGSD